MLRILSHTDKRVTSQEHHNHICIDFSVSAKQYIQLPELVVQPRAPFSALTNSVLCFVQYPSTLNQCFALAFVM